MAEDVQNNGIFINPLSDYGFKRVFGEKDIMMDFLNDLFAPDKKITDLTFLDKEMKSENKYEHGVIYDLRCKLEDGSEIIVEMQKGEQEFFADRIVYYLSRSVAPQGYKGKKLKDGTESKFVSWDFNLEPVYGVFFLNFRLAKLKPNALRKIQMTVNGTKEVFCDKVTAYTIELPDYKNYKESDCKEPLDYWNYIMTHMESLTKMPFINEKPIFERIADIASLATMSSHELSMYQDSVDAYRTTLAAFKYSEKRGREEGELIKAHAIAKNLKVMGLPTSQIASATGLSEEEISML